MTENTLGEKHRHMTMGNTFQIRTIHREHHLQSVPQAMLSIMTLILEEKVSQPLLDASFEIF
uniref:Uncharacterized protein n=1 Tax=Nelumbo nucifera TaxID=4432 RepID=A0A822Z8T7_NELNU|nr:TPA_asm: hypothetical protein HUJ06_014198 [Nelumbo nucifera]